jgi:DNA-binding response OmpR family regulator
MLMDTDLRLFEQALTNLVSNAIKFTPEHGKVIVVAKRLDNGQDPTLHLLIKDNGVGIPPEELPLIFDRYHQGTDDTNARTGTGIGLAMTREIIQTLGGEIDVESTVGKGSTFHIYLPIQNQASLATSMDLVDFHVEEKEPPADDVTYSHLPSVLIIEDNHDVVEYLTLCLSDHYDITTAQNGDNGLEKAFQGQPDIIISDVMMPGISGYEVCSTLKNDPRTEHIPIILLTARVTKEDRLHGLKQGADAYLAKPFEREELMIRLKRLLELRTKLQQKYSSSLASSLPPSPPEEEVIHAFVQKVENVILDNLDNDAFNIEQLASEVRLSRSQLHRKIKSLTGMSTSIYVRSVRLHKAKELLNTTDMNISEVAYAVGFSSPVYFSQVFKDTFGLSPSKFSTRH